jgi:hypothetical protein
MTQAQGVRAYKAKSCGLLPDIGRLNIVQLSPMLTHMEH